MYSWQRFYLGGPNLLKYTGWFTRYHTLGNPNSNGFESAPPIIDFAVGFVNNGKPYIPYGPYSFDGRRQLSTTNWLGKLNYSPDQVFHTYGRESFDRITLRSPTSDMFFSDLQWHHTIRLARTIR